MITPRVVVSTVWFVRPFWRLLLVSLAGGRFVDFDLAGPGGRFDGFEFFGHQAVGAKLTF